MAYFNIVWAAPRKTGQLEHLFKIQKKYCRLITFSHFQAHSKPLFQRLYILNVYNIYKLQLAIFMFKIINNLIPHTASFNFKASSTIHKHFTRYRENLHISYCRTSCRVSTVNIQGPKLWNYILNNHHELATLKSLNVFKSKFKKLLIFEDLCFNWLGPSLFLFSPLFFLIGFLCFIANNWNWQ